MDEEEGGEDEPDQDRLESHSRAGPHTAAAGTAMGIRLQRGNLTVIARSSLAEAMLTLTDRQVGMSAVTSLHIITGLQEMWRRLRLFRTCPA